jgi:predicted RNA-binding protein
MNRKYWLDLFTGKTWEEFLKSGGTVSGFRERRKNTAKKIHPGDYLICYLTGLSRFIGILEVLSDCYIDSESRIWEDDVFPIRFKVKVVDKLTAKTAVPIHTLKDRLSFFKESKPGKGWSGLFGYRVSFMKPGFIDAIAESCEPYEA